MSNPRDNMVYVVSLSKAPIKADGDCTWVDVVEKDKCYFHPVGKGWPKEPLNYIAFRYDGELQGVHYIESYKVVTDPSSVNKNWLKSDFDQFCITWPSNEAIKYSKKWQNLEPAP